MKTYIPTTNLLLYAKESHHKTFKPVSISGCERVDNLAYASLIPPSKFEQLKAVCKSSVQYGVQSYIKETGTNKILFKTTAK